jgi:hypothetical protein
MDQGVADDVESVLHGWGMPDDKWWRGADSAYISCCRILGNDLIPGHDAPRAGEPVVSVVPDGNFACHLSAQGDELNVAVVGSIRKSLFVEVVWQNILELQDSGVTIKVFQMSERKMVFEVGSFVFSVQYTECEELVRKYGMLLVDWFAERLILIIAFPALLMPQKNLSPSFELKLENSLSVFNTWPFIKYRFSRAGSIVHCSTSSHPGQLWSASEAINSAVLTLVTLES